jgi:hypothetical protein
MKNLTRLTIALVLGLCVAVSACKKSGTAPDKPAVDKTDYQALSKHIAVSFYKSLNSGSTGFKASSTGERRVLSSGPQCGDVVVTPTSYTQTGDTTRYYTGNSIFTYICNGGVLNEYSLVDTSTTRELSYGFASTYRVVQKYNVRATDNSYLKSASNGTIGVAFVQRMFNNGGVTTDSLTYATQYTLSNVIINRANNEAIVTGGQVTFASSVFHKDNVVDVDGWADEHTGVITFLDNYIIKVTFTQGTYSRSYFINAKTGAVVNG